MFHLSNIKYSIVALITLAFLAISCLSPNNKGKPNDKFYGFKILQHETPRVCVAGTSNLIPVLIQNTGSATWNGYGSVQFSYHVYDKQSRQYLWDGPRTPILHPVKPGEICYLDAKLETPITPGEYIIEYDLVLEPLSWFKMHGNQTLEVSIKVIKLVDKQPEKLAPIDDLPRSEERE